MIIAKNLKVVMASAMLLSLVSCGNDHKSHSAPQKQEDQIVQSFDWKILNGRGFPAKAMVELTVNGDTETLINECHGKQIHSINRASKPESLVVSNYVNPNGAETVNVKVFDLGADCQMESSPAVHSDDTVRLETNKSGAVAEVIVNI
jgi:hypothetical protein